MIAIDEEAVFLEALQKTSAEARADFLNQACGGDDARRRSIERLLKAHERAGDFLHGPVSCPADTLDQAITDRVGSQIGRYKLLEQVGEGGMGVVFVAEQMEPVRRRVALKIIKPGMDTRQVIARFEAERQALAMMDHPNIARVLDAGTTEMGRPYFVMELVRGTTITEYCGKERRNPRQRLELFVNVCQAVQHAHQKGIIHRDLKPSNVMITLHDGTPVVKVIDFGVAKAVGQQLTERTVYTALTQLVGTPLYMSPEQAEMSGLDVDTRSDVYSLGVMLYELLTETTPFEQERLKSVGFDEMRRIIREEEPETVSARLARTCRVGSAHQTPLNPEPRTLNPSTELDWIVMKALEKDRSRRYESASALATDIQRYLSDEPVLACPPTTMYRFQKIARKHKPALITAAATAVCLLLGTTVSAWQAARATEAEAQAKQATASEVQQRQRAEANEQKANTQRDEAQRQRDEIKALAEKLRRTLYASHINLAKHAWDAGNVARVRELLAQHRPQAGEDELRGFEWHYLNRLCNSELLTLKHSSEVKSVVFSADGKRLASASGKELKAWDAQTGRELFSVQSDWAWPVGFTPDGKRLVTVGWDIKEWDAETGQDLRTLQTKVFGWSAALSADGRRIAAACPNYAEKKDVLKVWDAQSGQEIATLDAGFIAEVAISSDGKLLAGGGQEPVKIWDADSGQELLNLKTWTAGETQCLSFSPDGKRLASASRDTIKVFDSQSGQELLSLADAGVSVAFSPDGKRLVGSGRDVRVWDLQQGELIRTIKGAGKNMVFSPDGQRLAGMVTDAVKIWDANKDQERITEQRLTGYRSPDGRLIANANADNTITVRDAASGQEVVALKGHTVPVWRTIAFSPDGKKLASGGGGQRTSSGGHSISADDRAELKVWDVGAGKELFDLSFGKGSVFAIAFSPDGARLAATVFPPPGEGALKVWDVATGQEIFSLEQKRHGPSQLIFTPDGKRLIFASGGPSAGVVTVRDASTGQELLSLKLPDGRPRNITISGDGKRLAASGNDQVKVWDAETGQELVTLKGHAAAVAGIAFSSDGRRMATTSGDETVKLWEAQTGQELLTLQCKSPSGVAFSADGHRLTVNPLGIATIYDATPLPEEP